MQQNNAAEEPKKSWFKRHPVLTVLGVLVVIGIITSGSGDKSAPTPVADAPAKEVAPSMSKDQAQKELDDLMATAKKAKLVTLYDFSKLNENTYRWDIFVGPTWYTQTVQQKKDFIGFIGIHKKAITGYSHFELRDAYSNEKVGEITSFSQSIEVYK